jgi:CRP/FNR family transcriptional regulator
MDIYDAPTWKNLDAFFTQHKNLFYNKGELLLRADDEPSGVYYLTEGIIKQYIISERGDELTTGFLNPIDVFPLSWAFNNSPNTYFYEALMPVVVWRAPKDDFLKYIKANPEVLFYLINLVVISYERLRVHVLNLIAGSVQKRLIGDLIFGARLFGKEVNSGTFTFEFKISERELASIINATSETISRELKLLKDKGLITFNKNKLTINDIVKLENELLESD